MKRILMLLLALISLTSCSTVTLTNPRCKVKLVKVGIDVNEIEVCKVDIE
jgi:hypothetical protein